MTHATAATTYVQRIAKPRRSYADLWDAYETARRAAELADMRAVDAARLPGRQLIEDMAASTAAKAEEAIGRYAAMRPELDNDEWEVHVRTMHAAKIDAAADLVEQQGANLGGWPYEGGIDPHDALVATLGAGWGVEDVWWPAVRSRVERGMTTASVVEAIREVAELERQGRRL